MNWHERYQHQAGWTRELRAYVFERCGWSAAQRVLEAGCGTGAVLCDPEASGGGHRQPQLHGLDISMTSLEECRLHAPTAHLTCGDVRELPYEAGQFDITYCHFLLLWVDDPVRALQEMKRVTVESGHVLALAEPDYGARVDKPAELARIGERQNEALHAQGAALRRGAELAGLFDRAGIRLIETGPIRSSEPGIMPIDAWEDEWKVLEADLAGSVPERKMRRLHAMLEDPSRRGGLVLSVPTYFAWGQV